MEKIRIYIADDHQLIVDGIISLLNDQSNLIFCGSSNNGIKAEEDILKLNPDIALIDIKMPGKDGLKLTQNLLEKKSTCKIIILSMYEETRYINDAKNFGAWGYLLKNTDKLAFIEAINKVFSSIKVFHKIITKNIKAQVFFTTREKEIIQLLKTGKTNLQIADILNIGIQTILSHRKNIREKTDTTNLAGLLTFLNDNNIFID